MELDNYLRDELTVDVVIAVTEWHKDLVTPVTAENVRSHFSLKKQYSWLPDSEITEALEKVADMGVLTRSTNGFIPTQKAVNMINARFLGR